MSKNSRYLSSPLRFASRDGHVLDTVTKLRPDLGEGDVDFVTGLYPVWKAGCDQGFYKNSAFIYLDPNIDHGWNNL